ncbi:hypothetical protein NEF87_000105 [Candidatus Lokiarchaeum ossiferum]|uniref:Histidine kinase N-terminal 7TM region domain-containing protein n=1 Tax=Candidatus Lokiarchaeum ossiferum TaxID=2951803 RepID=A0ABY6HKA7_9ARCH|nr:hypothetical protein NEF87_000105 [Candidatus Lokiarchaeum sp. B-35]
MALSFSAVLNGISGTIVLLIGMFYSISFLLMYRKKKLKLIPIVSLLAFCAGLIFLGVSSNFLSLVFTGNNLDKNTYGLLSYTIIPVATLVALYLGFHIFKPKWKLQITIFYSILWVVYWVCIFFFTDSMFKDSTEVGVDLLDISLSSVVFYLTMFYVFSLLFVLSGGFFSLSRKFKKEDLNAPEIKYLNFLSLGWALFGISSIIDSGAPVGIPVLIIIARIMMCTAYILIFEGFKGAK